MRKLHQSPLLTLSLYDISLSNNKTSILPKALNAWKLDHSCHFARVDQKSTSKCSSVFTKTVNRGTNIHKMWGHWCLEEFSSIIGFVFYCKYIKFWVGIPKGRVSITAGQIGLVQCGWNHPLIFPPNSLQYYFSNFTVFTNCLEIMLTCKFWLSRSEVAILTKTRRCWCCLLSDHPLSRK